MKKFFYLMSILFLLNACDDGDVAVQDISFESATGAICGSLAYKIKGNEVLIINFKDISKALINDQTKPKEPIVLNITDNSVTYRAYNAVPTAANFCGALPPASPIVVEEWTATGGTIEITSTTSKTTSTATTGNINAETIDGYNQLIILRNITFKKPNGEQFYEELRFGNIKSDFTPLNLTFNLQDIERCTDSGNNNLTARNGISTLISFNNITNLIQNTVTTTPRVAAISAPNNLYYRVFTNFDVIASKCALTYATTDTSLKQEWKATSGSVEVITTSSGAVFIHKVYLKGVRFQKGNSEFYLGDDFLLGEISTN